MYYNLIDKKRKEKKSSSVIKESHGDSEKAYGIIVQ